MHRKEACDLSQGRGLCVCVCMGGGGGVSKRLC